MLIVNFFSQVLQTENVRVRSHLFRHGDSNHSDGFSEVNQSSPGGVTNLSENSITATHVKHLPSQILYPLPFTLSPPSTYHIRCAFQSQNRLLVLVLVIRNVQCALSFTPHVCLRNISAGNRCISLELLCRRLFLLAVSTLAMATVTWSMWTGVLPSGWDLRHSILRALRALLRNRGKQ